MDGDKNSLKITHCLSRLYTIRLPARPAPAAADK